MRIAIIGAGAMGSIFGAMLSSVSEVYLINRSDEHIRAICRKGLRVEGPDGTKKAYEIFATTDPDRIKSPIDLAIIFTKSYDTMAAAQTARSLLGDGGIALTLQNGLGNLDTIAQIVGIERAAAGVTSHGGTLLEPGFVRHAGIGPTFIGTQSQNISLSPVAKIFEKAGIETTISDNLDSLIWGKLVINVGINALTAIFRVPNGILGITPECEVIMAHAVSEAVAVANALNIKLPYENPLAHVKMVCEKTAKNRASMLQDTLKGVRTEIGVINQAIVRQGKALGIPTPYNQFLTETVLAMEATSTHRV